MTQALSLPEQIELQEAIKVQSANIEFLSKMLEQAMENARLALDLADAQRWRPVAELSVQDKPVTVFACQAGASWISVFMLWPDGCWTDQDETVLQADELPTHFITMPAIPGK